MDINGLRALAVAAVVMFHFDVPGFSGGFIGVDIFFVISGFLMTQIICSRMLAADGGYSAVDFYRARARRIVPALAVLIGVLVALGAVFLIPLEYASLGRNALSALLFVSNIVFWRSSGYFETASHDNWLLHTWSLSVEWQFYLLLPILLLGLHRFRGGRHLRTAVLVLAVLSLLLSATMSSIRPAAAFYLLPTRCWELFAGGIAYFYQQRLRPHPLIDVGALAVIGASMHLYSSALPYPGYWALIPVAATALLLAAGSVSPLLNNRPMQFVGEISYSLYLWHWPLMVGMQYLGLPLTPAHQFAMMVLALLLAYLSFRFVEMPFRRRARPPLPAARIETALPAAAFSLIMLATLAVYMSDGLPQRLPAERRATVLANQARIDDWDYPERCQQNFRKQFPDGGGAAPVYCTIGASSERKILLWGDSIVEQLYPSAVQMAGTPGNPQIVMGTYAGCVPVRSLNRTEAGFDCPGFNQKLFERALQPDIQTVVLGGAWTFALGNGDAQRSAMRPCSPAGSCDSFSSPGAAIAFTENQLTMDIAALTKLGKRVLLILPFPGYQRPVALYLARGGLDARFLIPKLSHRQHLERNAPATAMLRRIAAAQSVRLIDPAEILCARGECEFERGGVALYRDGEHLVPDGARLLTPALASAIQVPATASTPTSR